MRHLYKLIASAAVAASLFASFGASPVAAQTASGSCAAISHTLARGDQGDEVLALQKFLVTQNLLDEENTSGFFGGLTEAAVQQWQVQHNLAAQGDAGYGIVGPRTRASFACEGGSAPASNPVPTGAINTQCPVVTKPTPCLNATAVQLSGCTVGWQCTVDTLPEQTFNATPTVGRAPLRVKFSGIVTSDNAGFCPGNFCASTLAFGDGTSGAVPLPNASGSYISYQIFHTYASNGSFVSSLFQGPAGSGAPTVGTSQTISPTAPVIPPGPSITANPNYGTAPLQVSFVAGNVSPTQSLSVDFGDGTYGTLQSAPGTLFVTHTYASAGSFNVKLRNGPVDCTANTCKVIATTAVTVAGGSASTPTIVATPSTGLVPVTVIFSMNGGNIPYSSGVILDYGDGANDILCNPGVVCGQKTLQHIFKTAGAFNVQMISATGGAGVVLAKTTVNASTQGSAALTATPNTGAVPLTVTFNGTGGGQIYPGGVTIDYGDGNVEPFCAANALCGQQNKTHTFNDGSPFGVLLIAGGTPSSATSTIATTRVTVTGGTLKVRVAAPTGNVRKGDAIQLQWFVFGPKPTGGTINFDLYSKAGTRIGTVLSITNFQTGSATWKVPSMQDTGCSSSGANGLCGTNLVPGEYRIVANVTGVSPMPPTTSDATFNIMDANILPGAFSIDTAPATVSIGRTLNIKYKVANPPYGGGTALWLVNSVGVPVGVISGKLDADTEATSFPWTVGKFTPAKALTPGTYYVLGKVYTPFAGDFTDDSKVTILATATSSAITINAAGTGAACITLNNNLAPGDTDDTTDGEVSALQKFLAEDATIYPEGTISGFFGPATRRAVERFQAANGIATSGSPDTNGYGAVGPKTRATIAAKCNDTNNSYAFRGDPAAGRVPLVVTFSAKSQIPDNSANYLVDFGDGSIGTYGTQSMSCMDSGGHDGVCPDGTPFTMTLAHGYTTGGTYIAKLQKHELIAPATCPNGAVCEPSIRITTVATFTVKVTNSAVPPPKTCAAITHTLTADDTDATTAGDVSRLQQFLAQDTTIYPEGLVTGYFGPATGRAVKRYQASKGLSQTSVVDISTLGAITCIHGTGSSVFNATPATGTPPLAVKFTTNLNVNTNSYRIEFGDGAMQWLSTSTASHTYSAQGTYTATLLNSIGNCFGLTGDALTICEIGAAQTVGTVQIVVGATPASISVAVSPTTIANGGVVHINWASSNAPAGSLIRLEAYPSGATEVAGNNGSGLAGDSSQLAISGSYNWTLPTAGAGAVDTGFITSSLPSGTYHITAKLYTGSTCWGFCSGDETRNISATSQSNNFTITGSGGGGGGGSGSLAASISCTNRSSYPTQLKVHLGDGTDKIYTVNTGFGVDQSFTDTYASAPTTLTAYNQVPFGGGGADAWSVMSGQLSTGVNSMSILATGGVNGVGGSLQCTVSWH